MTNIHFPVDGQGTQALKKHNKTGKNAFHVDTVAPESEAPDKEKYEQPEEQKQDQSGSTDIAPAQSKTTAKSRQQVSRNQDRRQEDRRHDNIAVLLNTRSEHDRRKTPGQRKDDDPQPGKQFGIDTKA
ncbi:MAG: hypothetical protein OEY36_11500 [Gammaproteobacteria bacterium]|nr:hypothetical protein [Gammaproteobacteria bacterium]